MFNLISNGIPLWRRWKIFRYVSAADQAHIYIDIVDRGIKIEKNLLRLFLTDCLQWKILEISAMQGKWSWPDDLQKTLPCSCGDITLRKSSHQKNGFH